MATTPEQNKALVHRMIEEGTDQDNPAVFDELIAPDAVDHTAPAGQERGREGVKRGHARFRAAFPDAVSTIDMMVAEGDLVAYHTTLRATDAGGFMDHPPTGLPFAGGGLTLVRVRDGQLVEHWSYLDTFGVMQRLGLVSAPLSAEVVKGDSATKL